MYLFVNSLLAGREPETNGEENLKTLTLAACESSEKNQVVPVEKLLEGNRP